MTRAGHDADSVIHNLEGRYAPLDGSDFQALGLAILRQCTQHQPAERALPLLTMPRRPAER